MATNSMWTRPPMYNTTGSAGADPLPDFDPSNPYESAIAREDWYRRNGYPDLEQMPLVRDRQTQAPEPISTTTQDAVNNPAYQQVSGLGIPAVTSMSGANIDTMGKWFGSETPAIQSNTMPNYKYTYPDITQPPSGNLEQAKLDVDDYAGSVGDLNAYYAKKGRFGGVEHVQDIQGIKGSGTNYAYGDPTQALAYSRLSGDDKSTVDDYKKKFDYRYGFNRKNLPKTTPYAYSS